MTDQIILLSEKSSGSSIFQKEIAKHGSINTVRWTRHNEAETLYWVKAASLLGYPDEAFWAAAPPFPPRWSERSIRRMLEHNLDQPPSPPVDWDYLKQGWDRLAESHGPVFMEKSPHHLNQWPALSCINRYVAETEMDVKFIGLVRNPLSVIYSTHTRWQTETYQRQFMWEQSYRNLLAIQQLHPDKLIMVRYEDLIQDPRGEFTRVLEFLGLDYQSEIGADLHAGSIERWKQDDSFSYRFAPAVMQLAHHFGYTREELITGDPDIILANTPWSIPARLVSRLRRTYDFYRNHVI